MSGQAAVLQVVILRDGLLVGTEVFVPGQYTIGSGDAVDLRLDDPSVSASHAFLYFQNGRAAIQDGGSGAVFVNGHRVNACEVRPVDEITCGPFTLKIRVLANKPTSRPAPPPDVAALLGQPMGAPAAAAPPASSKHAASTVVSPRRAAQAAAAPSIRAAPVQHVPSDSDDQDKTESVMLGSDLLAPTAPTRGANRDQDLTMPLSPPAVAPARPAAQARSPARSQPPARPAAPPPPAPAPARQAHAAKPARTRQAAHGAAKAQRHPHGHNSRFAGFSSTPAITDARDGKGSPTLFVELYWGDQRRVARAYKKLDPKKNLVAMEDDAADLPLWGFQLDGKPFVLGEQKGDLYRVYVPRAAAVERRAQDGNFYPITTDGLEVGTGGRRCVTLGSGHAVRLSGDGEMTMVAYVQPAIPKPFINPLRGLPWLALIMLTLFGSAFLTFVFYFADMPQEADFSPGRMNPVAVRLIAPPKKEEKKKIEKQLEKLVKKPEKKKPEAKAKELPKLVAQPTKKAIKSIEKLTAAGPAMKDLLAAVDKLGGGPGKKNAKNDYKLSGLLGKAPVANAGFGTFGIGGGGGGGMGMKGAELLRGKGGGGIGAMGTGRVGKGRVGGSVTRAVSRSVAAQGSIDKDAVAKVINSHLHEVSSCYERALIKTPGLAGKIQLEWMISTSGTVTYAKTKTSTMRSAAVESCILNSLKKWRFPAAKGSGVIITYPFMFNSVGF